MPPAQVMNRDAPFGGIQLVLSGDYFQLPPITKKWTPAMGNDAFLNRGYTFQCPAWRRCALQEVLLRKVSCWRRVWSNADIFRLS
jgi:ATP-dependent DNA helicase PIF1